MKKQRFLALTAIALAMTAANAEQAADDCSPAVLNRLPADVRQEVLDEQTKQKAEALLNQAKAATTADGMKTQAPDIKSQSCFDKYSNFKIVVGLGFPTMDGILEGLMNSLKNQACRVVDQQVNNATSGINGQINGAINKANQGMSGATDGLIPNVGGSANVGVGAGNAPGTQVNTGSDMISVGTQGRNQTGNLSGSVSNRFGQAVNGIFR